MAVPKRKVSKARRDKRRSSVWKLEAPALVKCDHCGLYFPKREAVLSKERVYCSKRCRDAARGGQ